MSGILPFADVCHPIWSPVAHEIHAIIWDRVGLDVVQGFVREWASTWNAEANDVKVTLQEPWQSLNPALPLPPSPHSPRSLAEKWATLAALHDVYDLTGDTVLPWPLPEDDHDLVALKEWMYGMGGAYCLLMRKASELRDPDTEVIRRWLTDVSRDTPPKVTKPNVLPKVVESATDREESSNEIEVPQDLSLREILTAGLSAKEMNKLAELIELEQKYCEHSAGKKNPFWKKRYQANRYQTQRAAKGKRDLALIARRIFEVEKDRMPKTECPVS